MALVPLSGTTTTIGASLRPIKRGSAAKSDPPNPGGGTTKHQVNAVYRGLQLPARGKKPLVTKDFIRWHVSGTKKSMLWRRKAPTSPIVKLPATVTRGYPWRSLLSRFAFPTLRGANSFLTPCSYSTKVVSAIIFILTETITASTIRAYAGRALFCIVWSCGFE